MSDDEAEEKKAEKAAELRELEEKKAAERAAAKSSKTIIDTPAGNDFANVWRKDFDLCRFGRLFFCFVVAC